MNNIFPQYLQIYFTFTNAIHSKYSTAEKLNLYIPKPHVELFRKLFAYSGADIWNTLPNDVKNLPSIKTFKSRYLKSFRV